MRRALHTLVGLMLVAATMALAPPTTSAQTAGFPSVGADFGNAGPFAVTVDTGPDHTYFSPTNLGAGGVRHPVVLWGNGTGASPTSYAPLLRHWASHGFIVAAANTPNAGSGAEMLQGLDNLTRFDGTQGHRFYGRVDTSRVATTGHSQGGFGSLRAAQDNRVSTAMPIQGAWRLPGIDGSIFYLSGGADTIVSPASVRNAYNNTTTNPAAYGELRGASHFEPARAGGGYRPVTTAWLRWTLMDDPIAQGLFVGPNCGLCTSSGWIYESNQLLQSGTTAPPPPPVERDPDLLRQLPPVAGERTPDGTIHRLYVALLGRVADPGGFDYWSRLHQRGESMTSIARQIAMSPEFVANFGVVDDRQFITLLYQHVFDRQPDPGGLNYWLGILRSGQASRAHMIVLFVDSPEMINQVRAARA